MTTTINYPPDPQRSFRWVVTDIRAGREVASRRSDDMEQAASEALGAAVLLDQSWKDCSGYGDATTVKHTGINQFTVGANLVVERVQDLPELWANVYSDGPGPWRAERDDRDATQYGKNRPRIGVLHLTPEDDGYRCEYEPTGDRS
ncbi:MAG: hypothetical protein KDB37_21245 [Ilumatobacter sp.]|nr:hypothetical protein [Ilumatobacter sp.]